MFGDPEFRERVIWMGAAFRAARGRQSSFKLSLYTTLRAFRMPPRRISR